MFNIYVLILATLTPTLTLGSSDDITQADIAECGSSLFGRVVCSSIDFYRECIAPGADRIIAIKLHRNLTNVQCIFKDTFGYRSNAVWVAGGCSGEFYICFTGDAASTYSPPDQEWTKPNPTAASVAEASNIDKVVIYIIIGSVILILVGAGLVVGCVVKQRHQTEKSRRIAAKRQIRIDQHREKRDQLEEAITHPPSSFISNTTSPPRNNSSFSTDYVDIYDNSQTEREGSICSSRSSNSGLTSVSCMTTGRLGQPYNKRFSFDQNLLKGTSTPDMRVLKGFGSEVNGYISSKGNGQNRNSISGSQTSLESIREICNRYKLYEIPLERRLSKPNNYYNRPTKYNTVGFTGPCLEKSVYRDRPTLQPGKRTVKALVHASNSDGLDMDGKTSAKTRDGKSKPIKTDVISGLNLNEQTEQKQLQYTSTSVCEPTDENNRQSPVIDRQTETIKTQCTPFTSPCLSKPIEQIKLQTFGQTEREIQYISPPSDLQTHLEHTLYTSPDNSEPVGTLQNQVEQIKPHYVSLEFSAPRDEIEPESHYHDPESILTTTRRAQKNADAIDNKAEVTPWSSVDEGIQKDFTECVDDVNNGPSISSDTSPIYATVNKRYACNTRHQSTGS